MPFCFFVSQICLSSQVKSTQLNAGFTAGYHWRKQVQGHSVKTKENTKPTEARPRLKPDNVKTNAENHGLRPRPRPKLTTNMLGFWVPN